MAVRKPDPYTRFVSSLLFPLQERLKGHASVAVRKSLERSQWWSAEELRKLQLERLRSVLIHIGKQVPYYRILFQEIGFEPTSIGSLDALTQIPFLDKDIIRNRAEDLKSETAGRLIRFSTGGSTGAPLIFFVSKERISHDVAAKWRATRWWGVDIGDPEIVLWGSPIEVNAQNRVRELRDWSLRTQLLPAFDMSKQNMSRFVKVIRSSRPRMLFGYPTALAYLASYAEEQGLSMTDLDISVAFVTGEQLYDHQREQIEHTFNCRVANGYGGRDAGFIAHECEFGGLHITAEDMIVEIVGKDGSPLPRGQAGEVVVTHLATKDFPFIRYRTGDIAVLDNTLCACGRMLPLMRAVQGRTTDFVLAPNGTVMHGLSLIYVVRDIPGITNFKIIQEDLFRTRVLLSVDRAAFRRSDMAIIKAGIRERLGKQVTVFIEEVDQIPRDASGKYRYVVSHVS